MSSHRRKNLLTGDWVLVSPQRTQRPWQGQVETLEQTSMPAYDPDCYLCPGNGRSSGQVNPAYSGPWAFDNDFPALTPDSGQPDESSPLFQSLAETGKCRVICYSERHDLGLSGMDDAGLQAAISFLFEEFARLDSEPGIAYVQMFENRGEMMGCSNPHPHAQVWATQHIPNEPASELLEQKRYFDTNGQVLLLDYLAAELAGGSRIVWSDEDAIALVPYWATWPFETLIVPRRPAAGPADLDPDAQASFARALQATLRAYDALFDTPMPYSMGFHPRPSDGESHPEWQFHAHFYPPLLRSATVRKHMVGFEMLGMPQRDITPESAAQQLRDALNKV